MINTFEETIEKLNIYELLEFKLLIEDEDGNKYVNSNIMKQIKNIMLPLNDKVYLKCLECGNKQSFYVHKSIYSYYDDNNNHQKNFDLLFAFKRDTYGVKKLFLDYDHTEDFSFSKINSGIYYFDYLLRCSHNNSHIQKLQLKLTITDEKVYIVKIAQDPINIYLVDSGSSIYSKQLKQFDSFQDYIDASASISRNLFPGATTYLRRIYEKMIKFYLDKEEIDYKNMKMPEKVISVEKYLGEDFLEISTELYGLLSLSVHELTNDQIQSYYHSLYGAIEHQLYYQKSLDDKEMAKEKINANIRRVSSTIKNTK